MCAARHQQASVQRIGSSVSSFPTQFPVGWLTEGRFAEYPNCRREPTSVRSLHISTLAILLCDSVSPRTPLGVRVSNHQVIRRFMKSQMQRVRYSLLCGFMWATLSFLVGMSYVIAAFLWVIFDGAQPPQFRHYEHYLSLVLFTMMSFVFGVSVAWIRHVQKALREYEKKRSAIAEHGTTIHPTQHVAAESGIHAGTPSPFNQRPLS